MATTMEPQQAQQTGMFGKMQAWQSNFKGMFVRKAAGDQAPPPPKVTQPQPKKASKVTQPQEMELSSLKPRHYSDTDLCRDGDGALDSGSVSGRHAAQPL